MNPNASAPRVIIRHCDAYYSERIRAICARGCASSASCPRGRTLVKPNLVAAGEMFPHAHTRAEFGEGVLLALQDVGADTMTELAVGERCGITIPTRYAFKHSGFDTRHRAHARREALLLRGGAAGRDPLHARGAPARLRVHPRADREGRLLRQRAQVQGAPVDDGDVLDEELHRDPGRPAPPHRSRPPAQREDRRPAVHHPAAVHRDRRDHRRRGADADAQALRAQPHHHGQQPGRVRRGVLRHHRRRRADASTTSASRPSAASARSDLSQDRRSRGDVTLERGAGSARRASRSGSSASRSTSRAAHHGLRGPAARGRAHRLLLGRLPGRDRGGHRDPAPLRQGVRQEDAAPARRLRRLRGADRREARREGRLHRRLREVAGQDRRRRSCPIESLYKDRSTKDPHKAEARRHLRQDAEGRRKELSAQRKDARTSASRGAR